jgi:hypothetical protein
MVTKVHLNVAAENILNFLKQHVRHSSTCDTCSIDLARVFQKAKEKYICYLVTRRHIGKISPNGTYGDLGECARTKLIFAGQFLLVGVVVGLYSHFLRSQF